MRIDPSEFTFKGPWFRSDEAAAYLGYRGKSKLRSLYRFLQKRGVPTARRFRTLLIAKRDLDEAIGAGHRTWNRKGDVDGPV